MTRLNFSLPEDYLEIVNKLVSRTKVIGDCYIWTGPKDSCGYGQLKHRGRIWRTHRLAAQLFRNAPDDMDIHTLHTCPNRNCWNPEHTYDGTNADNVWDSIRAGTHHLYGQEFRG